MHNQITVPLSPDWDDCPVWWQNMVNHLIHMHTRGRPVETWAHLNTRLIIKEHLQATHGATYVSGRHVQFPSEPEYCACVLAWS